MVVEEVAVELALNETLTAGVPTLVSSTPLSIPSRSSVGGWILFRADGSMRDRGEKS